MNGLDEMFLFFFVGRLEDERKKNEQEKKKKPHGNAIDRKCDDK